MQKTISELRFDVSFAVPSSLLFDLFFETCDSHHFHVIEQSEGLITAVNRSKMTLKSCLCHCLRREKSGELTAVRLQIRVNERKCKKTVVLKGIYGKMKVVGGVLRSFQEKMRKIEGEGGGKEKGAVGRTRRTYEALEDELGSVRSEPGSYYYMHKILASESYSLGHSLSSFFLSFSSHVSSLSSSSATDLVKSQVNSAVKALCSDYNLGKSGSEGLISLSRPAVEQFIFSHIGHLLLDKYIEEEKLVDTAFQERKVDINRLKNEEIWEILEVIPR